MRKLLLICLMLCGCLLLRATEQVHDKIEYDGINFTLSVNWGKPDEDIRVGWLFPLEEYFKQNNVSMRNAFRKYSASRTTNCHRGYIGQWQIKDGKLFLLGISLYPSFEEIERMLGKDEKSTRERPTPPENVLGLINENWESPVFAEWFSGDKVLLTTPAYGAIAVYQVAVKEGMVTDITPLNTWLADAVPNMEKMFKKNWDENQAYTTKAVYRVTTAEGSVKTEKMYDIEDDGLEERLKNKPFFLLSNAKMSDFRIALRKLNPGMDSLEVEAIFKEVFEEVPVRKEMYNSGRFDIRYYVLSNMKTQKTRETFRWILFSNSMGIFL